MAIFVVDDSPTQRYILEKLLTDGGFTDISSFPDATVVLKEMISNGPADVLLLDIEMPGINGIEFCRKIKKIRRLRSMPIIMITAQQDDDTLQRAFDAGAMDYITKPPKAVELIARVKASLRLSQEMHQRHQREKELLELTRRLTSANEMLERLAVIDELTKLSNRRFLDKTLEQEWYRALRTKQPLGFIMMDIDFFKKYNDNYGHLAGDDCLAVVAGAIRDCLQRSADMVARYGGEEFCAVLPGNDAAATALMAEKMRQAVENLGLEHAHSDIAKVVTISLGVASLVPDKDLTVEDIIHAADQALYEAKKAGRNRVHSAKYDSDQE